MGCYVPGKNRNIEHDLHNVNNALVAMIVPLTHREIELILGWKAKAFWPDEERVLSKLRRALQNEEPLKLSRVQIQIVQGWIEEQVGGHYGGGAVINPEEQSIAHKLRAALEGE